ncbi:MAG: hypothetical protein M1835_001359 [Candelina submexicana]|nr:MAG: hypothetical protein M1835_001359 [Candelina submexicana]
MPAAEAKSRSEGSLSPEPLTSLPFPPVTKGHILHCSYHSWHERYRSITPKARLIPLTPSFLAYLRSDGIVLPSDSPPSPPWSDSDSGVFSGQEDHTSDSESEEDPSVHFREIHQQIKDIIAELGGKVAPKLNWSAPKDATWISATNSMECRLPSEVYLLLKSSDFVSHDLEHAFDGCIDSPPSDPSSPNQAASQEPIPYHLVLRKYILLNPSVEFRCFVRQRTLLAISQRDLNHFDFLFPMKASLQTRIQTFFDDKLRDTFPDENFVYDVYIPPPHKRVWLIDINPWAPRTDPLLFSWLELLTMERPDSRRQSPHEDDSSSDDTPDEEENDDDEDDLPIFRLVKRDDPEAYSFNTPQYSAHKLPKDVVDASVGGPGPLREFADQWKSIVASQEREDGEDEGQGVS